MHSTQWNDASSYHIAAKSSSLQISLWPATPGLNIAEGQNNHFRDKIKKNQDWENGALQPTETLGSNSISTEKTWEKVDSPDAAKKARKIL